MEINYNIKPDNLAPRLQAFWESAVSKTSDLQNNYDISRGSPVYTVRGTYQSREWTEWTRGFFYGIPILVFDIVEDTKKLDQIRRKVIEHMLPHVSHFGVHDHGFNIVSTYGNLLRLINEERLTGNGWEKDYYMMALNLSGSVQAKRWTKTKEGGFIYSFNGPHSLFVDTLRSCRILNLAHIQDHKLLDENDQPVDLHDRAVQHAFSTARYSVYYGDGRDAYDVRGRVAHESVFNINDGTYRCPSTQQGYSPFSTWTRGLAWAILGFTELLEFEDDYFSNNGEIKKIFLKAALATSDFYLENSSLDGIPYWDTGAPFLYKLGEYQKIKADPYNEYEPVDSSAAAIAAQGLLRLAHYLKNSNDEKFQKYFQAGLTVAETLLNDPYISIDKKHQGLLLHSVYHRPKGWDFIPAGAKIPSGESGMWGDYHMTELSYYLWRVIHNQYYTFYSGMVNQ